MAYKSWLKRNVKQVFLEIFFVSLSLTVFGQGEIDDRQKILLRNESSIAFSLNSNGIGGNYRYGKRITGYKKMLFQVDFNYLKHQKEIKTTSPINTTKSFVYGKLNSFFTLHLSVGRQKEIYSKFDKGGISINYFYQIGPSFGILKPKFYKVTYAYNTSDIEDFTTFVNKTQNYHVGYILGNAAFSEGLDDTKIKPGVFISAGTNFEFSKRDKYTNAIEAGINIDLFTDEIPIMYSADNDYQQVFLTLFLVYRIGKVIDGRSIQKE